jgi:peptidoglycan hydrolase CwlO-like protein
MSKDFHEKVKALTQTIEKLKAEIRDQQQTVKTLQKGIREKHEQIKQLKEERLKRFLEGMSQ